MSTMNTYIFLIAGETRIGCEAHTEDGAWAKIHRRHAHQCVELAQALEVDPTTGRNREIPGYGTDENGQYRQLRDLADRASVFHAYRTAAECVRQARQDPEAWTAYVEWHESARHPEAVLPEDAAEAIRRHLRHLSAR